MTRLGGFYRNLFRGGAVIGIVVLVMMGVTKLRSTDPANVTLDQFLKKVQREGGTLVKCENKVCRDINSGDLMGTVESDQQDGYYILFDTNRVSEDHVKDLSLQLKQILDKRK